MRWRGHRGSTQVRTVSRSVSRNRDCFAPQEKCDEVAKAIGAPNITTDQVDADSVEQLVALLKKHQPQLVVNLALPYQDLTIMEACLECGVNYLDTANYEPATRLTLSTAGNGLTARTLRRLV